MNGKEIPNNQKKILKNYFNKSTEQWKNLYKGDSFIDIHMCERKEIVLNMVDELSGKNKLRILDLGCGGGILSKELIERGHFVVCADIAIDLLTIFNESVKKKSLDNYLGGTITDAGKICISDSSFDVVLCIGVMQYQTDDNLIINEIRRVLNKTGVSIISFPNLLRINYLFDPYYYIKYLKRRWTLYYKKKIGHTKVQSINSGLSGKLNVNMVYDKKYFLSDVHRLLSTNKFEIIKCIGFGFGPFTLINKQIINDKISLLLSFKMRHWVRKSDRHIFDLAANRWVLMSKKYMAEHSTGE